MFHVPAFIFDFDGVIANSMNMHMSAWQQAYHAVFQIPLNDPNRIAGMDSIKIARMLSHELGQQSKWEDFLARKRALVLTLVDTIELLPGAALFLESLPRQEIKHAICTNATRPFIYRILGNHGIEVPPNITVEDVKHPKPHPEPYLKAIELLGIPQDLKSQVIVFEDSRHGVRSAKEAGLHCIGIRTMHTTEELRSAGAKQVVGDLAEAAELLKIT